MIWQHGCQVAGWVRADQPGGNGGLCRDMPLAAAVPASDQMPMYGGL